VTVSIPASASVLMPSPEYGQLAQQLSTRLVHVISEAFIYALFIASLWIIHLNESARNMNAMRGDRIDAAPALNLHARQDSRTHPASDVAQSRRQTQSFRQSIGC
jgi:hypothetical protein